jgi:hypothetical protein
VKLVAFDPKRRRDGGAGRDGLRFVLSTLDASQREAVVKVLRGRPPEEKSVPTFFHFSMPSSVLA